MELAERDASWDWDRSHLPRHQVHHIGAGTAFARKCLAPVLDKLVPLAKLFFFRLVVASMQRDEQTAAVEASSRKHKAYRVIFLLAAVLGFVFRADVPERGVVLLLALSFSEVGESLFIVRPSHGAKGLCTANRAAIAVQSSVIVSWGTSKTTITLGCAPSQMAPWHSWSGRCSARPASSHTCDVGPVTHQMG